MKTIEPPPGSDNLAAVGATLDWLIRDGVIGEETRAVAMLLAKSLGRVVARERDVEASIKMVQAVVAKEARRARKAADTRH